MSDKVEAALHGQTAVEEVKMGHVPREVFFGYPVEPGETVGDDYIETCMVCNDAMPCAPLRAVEELEALTDRLAGLLGEDFEYEMELVLEAAKRWDSGYADAAAALPVIHAHLRAVVDGRQPEHSHEGDRFRAGVCCGAPHCKAVPHIEGCFATDPDSRDDSPVQTEGGDRG